MRWAFIWPHYSEQQIITSLFSSCKKYFAWQHSFLREHLKAAISIVILQLKTFYGEKLLKNGLLQIWEEWLSDAKDGKGRDQRGERCSIKRLLGVRTLIGTYTNYLVENYIQSDYGFRVTFSNTHPKYLKVGNQKFFPTGEFRYMLGVY